MSKGMPEVTDQTHSYLSKVQDRLAIAIAEAKPELAKAGTLIAERFSRDGLLFIFGSGHSHVFAEEAFYRAGGSARVCPILIPEHMLHISARQSTELERQSGLAENLLSRYQISPERDVLLVVSNSGANRLPIEVAVAAKERNIPVIAITSLAYAKYSSAPGDRLHDVADFVLDNQCPPGDALVNLGDNLPKVGPASSVVGIALLNALIIETLARQVAEDVIPEIYMSSGMPGAPDANNAISDRFTDRIPHL